jgi:hypothetical protein
VAPRMGDDARSKPHTSRLPHDPARCVKIGITIPEIVEIEFPRSDVGIGVFGDAFGWAAGHMLFCGKPGGDGRTHIDLVKRKSEGTGWTGSARLPLGCLQWWASFSALGAR